MFELTPTSAGISVVVLIGIGNIVLFNSNDRQNLIFHLGWYMTKGLTIISHYSIKLFNIFYMKRDKIEREVQLINREIIFEYNYNAPPSYCTQHRPTVDMINKSKMSLLFVTKYKDNEINKYISRFDPLSPILDKYEISKIKFLAMQITLAEGDVMYGIDFKKDNYYMVGNILLDRDFCEWWLYKTHSVILKKDDHYEVSFIDHNIKEVNIKCDEGVLINEDNYEIIKITHDTSSDGDSDTASDAASDAASDTASDAASDVAVNGLDEGAQSTDLAAGPETEKPQSILTNNDSEEDLVKVEKIDNGLTPSVLTKWWSTTN